MTMRYPFLILALLAIAIFFSPLVYLIIGPLGKIDYGPTVPDIHIHGGWITGKDLRWLPIFYAMIFQAVCIAFYALLCILCLFIRQKVYLLSAWYINLALLLCFPLWLTLYVDHVLNNSDGAAQDMGFEYHFGLYLYGILLIAHVLVLFRIHTKFPQRLA